MIAYTGTGFRGIRCGLIVVIALAVAGCGLPQNGTTRTIARGDVPYRLLDPPGQGAPSSSPPGPSATTPQLFFVNRDDLLVAQPQPVNASGVAPVVTALLSALAAGPTRTQRQRGLATALGPDVTLELLGVRNRSARIALVPVGRPPDAERLPLAVGQVVLTATSVEGVDSVVIVQNKETLELPLPGGERTSDPVTAQDYATLLADRSAASER